MSNVVFAALPVHAEDGASISNTNTESAAAAAVAAATGSSSSSSGSTTTSIVQLVPPSPDVRKLFNEARAYESQGNLLAAQKLYEKITVIAPRFLYGWSNLGNVQTAFGDLTAAEQSYTIAIDLCDHQDDDQYNDDNANIKNTVPDYYMLRLNRGTLRINNGRSKEGLADLQLSSTLRGRPDPVVLQNLARAEELNGMYREADRDYTAAIQMTANTVVPFWLRSALVKYQLGDMKAGNDILKRVENRFPQAPEVRAASAVYLWRQEQRDQDNKDRTSSSSGDNEDDDARTAARQKFLLIPDRARLKYVDPEYVTNTIHWPPAMVQTLREITKAVGDDAKTYQSLSSTS